MAKYGTGETMAARVKKRAGTSTNRESDKIIVRLPEGMRQYLSEVAARNGRSMNAEVVRALEIYFVNEYASPKESQSDATTLKDLADQMEKQHHEFMQLITQGNELALPESKGYRLSAGLETAIRDLVEQIFQHPEFLGRLIKKGDTGAAREAAIEADIGAAREADIRGAREEIEARAAGRSSRRTPK
jgi:hypothetical protein